MNVEYRNLPSVSHVRPRFCWLRRGLVLFASTLAGVSALASDQVQLIEPNQQTGTSSAVLVHDMTLIHTAQFLPASEHLHPGSTSAADQLRNVLEQIQSAIGDSGKSTVVKLNLYVTSDDVAAEVRKSLPLHFKGDHQPAVSLVVTRLPPAGAVVAADAVACRPGDSPAIVSHATGFTSMPPGTRIYVSGQAEQSESLAEATQKTLESLHNTLTSLGRSDDDIIQLKAFLQPMSDADEVRKRLAEFFVGKPIPPLILVEWESSRTTPIEIELIAWGGEPHAGAPQLEFLTPPGMTASPIYCRVCRINDPRTIFLSGLYSSDTTPPIPGAVADAEVQSVFASLEHILKLADSDFKHLAKATYYVSTDSASASLNRLRPGFYDPMRPPAASKAVVESVGIPGLGLTIDMIAVPNLPDAQP